MSGPKRNYLPFIKRVALNLPAPGLGLPRLSPTLWDMATGGVTRAHLHDMIIMQGTDTADGSQFTFADQGGLVRMRLGISGKGFLTENLYDYRAFVNGPFCQNSVWDWSRGGRFPYTLRVGQKMRVVIGAGVFGSAVQSYMFNGVRTKDNKPVLLYNVDLTATPPGGVVQRTYQTQYVDCPGDSDVDLYSITLPEWCFFRAVGGVSGSPALEVYDGNGRPFWDTGGNWRHLIDPTASLIELGDGWDLTPGEVLTQEFENLDPLLAAQSILVILRGVLEVGE